MAPILSEEQRRALEASQDGGPIEVVDPVTHERYLLVRADLFARVAAQADPALAGDFEEAFMSALD